MLKVLFLLFVLMPKPPRGVVAISPTNPFASALVGAFAMSEALGTKVGDQVSCNPTEGTLSGTTLPVWAGVNDTGLKFAGGANLASYVTFGAPSLINDLFGTTGSLTSGSVYMKCRMGATNTAGGLIGKNDDNATTRGWQILLAAGPTIQFTNEATANGTGTIVAPAANTDFDLLWTYTGAIPATTGNLVCYLNGSAVTVTIVAGGATPKTSDAADPLRIGTTTGFAANGSFDGYAYMGAIWKNRIITSTEYTDFRVDPYQVFAAIKGPASGSLYVGPRLGAF